MKVTVIYDFSSEEIEDFSKDKVQIELSFEEFAEIRDLLEDVWFKEPNSELGYKAKALEEILRNYETESKF